jgi:hypothetical protein
VSDYNDGKWHGWNGGECPVHPKSVVDLRWKREYDTGDDNVEAGYGWDWDKVVAFRVVKLHHEPREWWATGNHLHDTKEEAEAFIAKVRAEYPHLNFEDHDPVLVREVLE